MDWMIMPLKRYGEFNGRSRRTEFWLFVLLQLLIGISLIAMVFVVGGSALSFPNYDPRSVFAASGPVAFVLGLNWLLSMVLLIPNLAVTVRRLHDTDRSGWWVILLFVPYSLGVVSWQFESIAVTTSIGLVVLVGSIAVFVFMLIEGTAGPNRFGEDPKERSDPDVFA